MSIERLSTDHDFYRQALELRYELFFKEYDLPKSILQDDLELTSEHFGITQESELLAYGRLTELGFERYKISQVVVRPSLQRRGYGKALLSAIIEFAMIAGAKAIELNTQVYVAALYRELGFKEAGNIYSSKTTGVPHVKMVLGPVT